ncbi:ABC transporter ATP-binding protein [Paenibacillus athensensis]|uniref:Macrolide ABC transporter ATP-binding protein n=1 Tax=Paenibacillus athensensis TaxID=1967502 RepID=A0A4Y8PWK9_9BACL|nr:ABC transporter ATP-binding protein [Paenibacillus athensensis]MCD1258780.1 ABC transporter ATP-binding protein [Paenibacillus athensensis]
MISLRRIRKTYSNGDTSVHALSEVDLDIAEGEFVAIMGASGSGKSTLMNILGCLDEPTDGTYTLDGQQVQAMSEEELAYIRNHKVGFVFQSFNLIPRMSVLRNVELPMIYGKLGKEQRQARGKMLLSKVGLGERMQHKPSELSGGQRQRAAIARALAMEPVILLADEPTGNLDSRTSHEIMSLFQHLNEEGATIIIVTHEADIAEYAKRVLRFGDGLLLEDRRKGGATA